MTDALHSPSLLQELGLQVRVNEPGPGISRRGTKEAAPFHGDVVRKLLAMIARTDKAQKRLPGQSLLAWYNQHVGRLFCQAARTQPILHILAHPGLHRSDRQLEERALRAFRRQVLLDLPEEVRHKIRDLLPQRLE